MKSAISPSPSSAGTLVKVADYLPDAIDHDSDSGSEFYPAVAVREDVDEKENQVGDQDRDAYDNAVAAGGRILSLDVLNYDVWRRILDFCTVHDKLNLRLVNVNVCNRVEALCPQLKKPSIAKRKLSPNKLRQLADDFDELLGLECRVKSSGQDKAVQELV